MAFRFCRSLPTPARLAARYGRPFSRRAAGPAAASSRKRASEFDGQLHRDIMGQVNVEILSVGPRELQTSYAHGRQLHVPRSWDMIERYFEVCGFSGRQQRG